MQVMMADSVTTLCGPKGRHDADRSAVRHGSEKGSVTLGGRRVPMRRPRARSGDGTTEVAIPAYELFSSTELLGEMALERMMAKLSTRRYGAGLEPVGAAVEATARSTSKSAVSRPSWPDQVQQASVVGLAVLADGVDPLGSKSLHHSRSPVRARVRTSR